MANETYQDYYRLFGESYMRTGIWFLIIMFCLTPLHAAESACRFAFPVDSIKIRSEPSVVMMGRIVKRISFDLNGHEVVVIVDKPALYAQDLLWLHTLIGDDGRLRHSENTVINPSQNCHAFACSNSGLQGLPANWWIVGKATAETKSRNSMLLLLAKYYDKVQTYSASAAMEFTDNKDLKTGDLVVFVN